MCNFFTFCSDGTGKTYYFDWARRKGLLMDNPKNYSPDSHASIAEFYSLKEDKLNKYEFNPFLKTFQNDQINSTDDSSQVEKWVKNLDFKKIIKPLIIKPIINPLTIIPLKKLNQTDKDNLKKWSSVWASVWSSVWASVRDSVGASVRDSVRASVWYSVWYSVSDSVWASVRDSVWYSVSDSVRAYIYSFFDIEYKYEFSCCTELWEMGFVPSFDGKTWRLHQGEKAKIVYEFKVTK